MSRPPYLRPFWSYYGGKFRAARKYPSPEHETIVEPFAGSAGYSLRYYWHKVVLVEKYPVVAEMWRWLIRARRVEVMAIPLVLDVRELPSYLPEGARSLVGFNLAMASASPQRLATPLSLVHMSKNRSGWSAMTRSRVADQVDLIRHWHVIEGDYSQAPDVEVTWFVDPPYQKQGVHYVHSAKDIDFCHLGRWCRSRRGQVVVCENEGADWLPFRPLYRTNTAMTGSSNVEAIWTNEDGT